jgi:hypothetical protein
MDVLGVLPQLHYESQRLLNFMIRYVEKIVKQNINNFYTIFMGKDLVNKTWEFIEDHTTSSILSAI